MTKKSAEGYFYAVVEWKKGEVKEQVGEKVKIAGFDMDWTLIRTKTGKTFPKDQFDWLPLFGEQTVKKIK